MKSSVLLSLLFPVAFGCVSCAVTAETTAVDKAKQAYMDSVFRPYPDASIVGLSAEELLEELERYHTLLADTVSYPLDAPFFEADSAGNLVATVFTDVLFDYDKSDIRPEQSGVIDTVAAELLSLPESPAVSLVGHTDDRGTDEYNLALSQRRARAVADYITERYAGKIAVRSVLGLGESKPISSNHTPEGRQQNRRVEFIVHHGGE